MVLLRLVITTCCILPSTLPCLQRCLINTKADLPMPSSTVLTVFALVLLATWQQSSWQVEGKERRRCHGWTDEKIKSEDYAHTISYKYLFNDSKPKEFNPPPFEMTFHTFCQDGVSLLVSANQ